MTKYVKIIKLSFNYCSFDTWSAHQILTNLWTGLAFWGPIRVPIWHIEAYHPDLRSWTPLALLWMLLSCHHASSLGFVPDIRFRRKKGGFRGLECVKFCEGCLFVWWHSEDPNQEASKIWDLDGMPYNDTHPNERGPLVSAGGPRNCSKFRQSLNFTSTADHGGYDLLTYALAIL